MTACLRDLIGFMRDNWPKIILLPIIFASIPTLFILQRFGFTLAGQWLHHTFYLTVCLGIISVTMAARTLGNQVRDLVCTIGILLVEMNGVAYLWEVASGPEGVPRDRQTLVPAGTFRHVRDVPNHWCQRPQIDEVMTISCCPATAAGIGYRRWRTSPSPTTVLP